MIKGGEHSDGRVQQPLSRLSWLSSFSHWLRARGDNDEDDDEDDDDYDDDYDYDDEDDDDDDDNVAAPPFIVTLFWLVTDWIWFFFYLWNI